MTVPTDGTFDPAVLMRRAQEETGLSDFGDPDFAEPLDIAAAALDTEAGLSATGRVGLSTALVDFLAARLRVEEWIARKPEILAETIAPPVVIAGLPRTGTTLLYRMLSVADDLTAPLHYEVRDPAPPLDWDFRADSDPRIAVAEAAIAGMNEAVPELVAIYPFEAVSPEEDIFLLEKSLRSTGLHAYARIPTYEAWFAAADKTPAYTYLDRTLRLLQWQRSLSTPVVGAGRWLLKSPDHLHSFDELLAVFPYAKVIQTHRDPVTTIPSICSFIRALHSLSREHPDPVGIGQAWSAMFAASMTQALAVRERYPDSFLDIWYDDTVNDPRAVAEQVFDFVGHPFDEPVWAEMQRWREANKREARPEHHYTLEEFGLTAQGIAASFAEYRETFILPRRSGATG
jgi:hypothetical protein